LRSFARFLTRVVDTLEQLQPDVILLLGDRWEMLAGAMAGSYMNLLVAHIHGGELSGSIDEPNRHAITRFSHLHFVATRQHARLLCEIGEEPSRIHIIGSPGLDDIATHNYAPKEVVGKKYHLVVNRPHALLVQHPVVTERHQAGEQMTRTIDAIVRLGISTTAIYPNADAGGRVMIRVMEKYAKRHHFIRPYKNITRDEYLGLMAVSSVIVGNSSSGIIEAASMGVPAVNIGTRQQGRIHPGNVIDVDYDTAQIAQAIRKGLATGFRTKIRGLKNPYGNGRSGVRIAKILSKIRPTPILLQKRLTFRMVQ